MGTEHEAQDQTGPVPAYDASPLQQTRRLVALRELLRRMPGSYYNHSSFMDRNECGTTFCMYGLAVASGVFKWPSRLDDPVELEAVSASKIVFGDGAFGFLFAGYAPWYISFDRVYCHASAAARGELARCAAMDAIAMFVEQFRAKELEQIKDEPDFPEYAVKDFFPTKRSLKRFLLLISRSECKSDRYAIMGARRACGQQAP